MTDPQTFAGGCARRSDVRGRRVLWLHVDEGKRLAELLVSLRYEDLSEGVIQRAKHSILDQLGVQLAASTKPWSVIARRHVSAFDRRREATVVNYGDRVDAESAAFANAAFGHGFELDDTYLPGNVHPGCVVIPAALAVAERQASDGRAFLLAVVCGYEAMCRIARAVAPSCAARGFHPTSAAGPFGSAAAAGKLLGFSSEVMLDALGIAGSHSSGLGEFTQTGGTAKGMHAGIVSSGGIRSALLAQAGLTGPPTALEGKRGFCRAFSDQYRVEELTSDAEPDPFISAVSFKRHCWCYEIQAPLDVILEMVESRNINPREIDEIVLGTNENAAALVGTILEPTEVTAAQFSAPFMLAMAVLRGSCGFRDLKDEVLRDPAIRQLATTVRLEVDAEAQALYPTKKAVRLTVRLRDGTTYEQWRDGARGTPDDPMTEAEIEDKFLRLATVVLPYREAELIREMVSRLDALPDVSSLCDLLVARSGVI